MKRCMSLLWFCVNYGFRSMHFCFRHLELAKKSDAGNHFTAGRITGRDEQAICPLKWQIKKASLSDLILMLPKRWQRPWCENHVREHRDGIIPALVTEKIDIIISGMTVTQERNLKVNFADPYIIIGQTILLNKKHEGVVTSYRG